MKTLLVLAEEIASSDHLRRTKADAVWGILRAEICSHEDITSDQVALEKLWRKLADASMEEVPE
jgi:hypothetical protein